MKSPKSNISPKGREGGGGGHQKLLAAARARKGRGRGVHTRPLEIAMHKKAQYI